MAFCCTNRTRSVSSRAWKVMLYDRDHEVWATPYRAVPVRGRVLAAEGSPHFLKGWAGRDLYGGAIHCFRQKWEADWHVTSWFRGRPAAVFEVKGSGYIAHTNWEVAFKSVTFIDNPDDWEI